MENISTTLNEGLKNFIQSVKNKRMKKKEADEEFAKKFLDDYIKKLNDKLKDTQDDDEKEEIKYLLDDLMTCRYEDGDPKKDNTGDMMSSLKDCVKTQGSGFDILDFEKDFKEAYKKHEENFKKESEEKDSKDGKDTKEEPKEETVKSNDGVEWIKRKKERGEGYTYCRKDDHSVTMSQKEWRKHNATKNEGVFSLKNYLNEALESEDSEDSGDQH